MGRSYSLSAGADVLSRIAVPQHSTHFNMGCEANVGVECRGTRSTPSPLGDHEASSQNIGQARPPLGCSPHNACLVVERQHYSAGVQPQDKRCAGSTPEGV